MQLIITFLQIFLFRKGPQDVPYSVCLMLFLLTISAAVRVVLLNLANVPYAWALVASDYVFLALFIALALRIRKLSPRFLQTFSAVLGVELVELGFIGLINLLTMYNEIFADTLVQFWGWAVLSSIIRQALNVKVTTAVLLTFCYQLFVLSFYWLIWGHL